MQKSLNYNPMWMRIMYLYTLIVGGIAGLLMLIIPDQFVAIMNIESIDPVTFGTTGSFFVATAFVSALALKKPLKFAPILFVQIIYKVLWLIAVFLPLMLSGSTNMYSIIFAVIYLTFIAGDFLAVPWAYMLNKTEGP
ncbi:MAG: hypothetical protein ACLFR1_03960 [Spirochaetia bacterium]